MASLQYPIITKYGSLKTYKENYQKDLEVYLEEDEDNKEIYYLEKDLLAHEEYLKHLQTKEIEIDKLNQQRVNEPIEARETRKEIIRARHELNYIKNERKINRNKNIIKFIEQRILEIETETLPTININENRQSITEYDFKNNFDNVPELAVYEYFKDELVNKKYISEDTLRSFLTQAFEKQTITPIKFSFHKIRTKRETIDVFYRYFSVIAQKPYGQKNNYLKLLTNYFNGYDFDKIKTNFSS